MPKGRPKTTDMYGIFEDKLGFEVRIVRETVLFNRSFYNRACGGRDNALVFAQAWRDQVVQLNPPQLRKKRASKVRVNNKSGTAGVYLMRSLNDTPVAWLAKTYLAPGLVLRQRFNISDWGDEGAKARAVAARAEQIEQMEGLARVHPAEAIVRTKDPVHDLPALPAPVPKAEIVRASNSTGHPGVVRRKGRVNHPGYWTAQTFVGELRKTRSFSVALYGEDGAKDMAIAERRNQLAEATALATPPKPSRKRRSRS